VKEGWALALDSRKKGLTRKKEQGVRKTFGSTNGKRMSLDQMLASFDAQRFAVLATSGKESPYASLIAFAMTPDRRTLIFATQRATSKYENMKSRPAVSILLDSCSQHADDLRNAQAITLLGMVKEVKAGTRRAEYGALLAARHPELASFIDGPGTALITVAIRRAVHVARFQDVSYWP